jgi:hypothetical protein
MSKSLSICGTLRLRGLPSEISSDQFADMDKHNLKYDLSMSLRDIIEKADHKQRLALGHGRFINCSIKGAMDSQKVSVHSIHI